MYNACFTFLPVLYYLMDRPELISEILVEDYKDYKLTSEHVKGMLSGILLTLITFLILPNPDIQNIFIIIMINCTLLGNLYYLVIDDSVSKKIQIITIFIQCTISIMVYLLTAFFLSTPEYIFELDIQISPDSSSNYLIYLLIFLINPLIIFTFLFFLAIHKSIETR